MKKTLKKFYTTAFAVLLVFGIYSQIPKNTVNAQQCASDETSGNLFGYLETDEMGFIYLSTDSWNDDPLGEGHAQTTELFSVSYDRQTNRFDGRGWSPYAGWVDFGLNSTDQFAVFESMLPGNDPNGLWGNMTSVIDISNVSYQTDPGGFVGMGFHGAETGDDDNGNLYGAGNVDFSNVAVIQSPCVQFVIPTVNGARNISQTSCPVATPIYINWSSENVTDCQIASDNWTGPSNLQDAYRTGNAYTYIGTPVTDTNPASNPIVIQCTGANGAIVRGVTTIACGSSAVAPTTEGSAIPTYQEV